MNAQMVIISIALVYLVWKLLCGSTTATTGNFTGKRVVIRSKDSINPIIIPTDVVLPVPYFSGPGFTGSSTQSKTAFATGTDLSSRIFGVSSFPQTEVACKAAAYDHIMTNKNTGRKYTVTTSYVQNLPKCYISDGDQRHRINSFFGTAANSNANYFIFG